MSPIRHGNEPPIPAEVRKAVLKRAHARLADQFGICEDCLIERYLELHHVTYSKWGHNPQWAIPIFGRETPDDLRALCRECHKARHIDPYGNFCADPEEVAAEWEYYDHLMESEHT